MMRLFRRNSKSISNTSDTSQQVITPSDNSQDIIEDNTNTNNNNNTDGEENQIPADISAVEKVDEMDNTLVNSVSGDTINTSTEIPPNTTTIDTTDTNNSSTVTTKNTSSSNSTAGDGRNVENDVVKRRNNMRSRRKSMKNYNNSYHNSPYYSHYASPNYANNYTGPNYSTANYTNNYGAPNYPTHSYTFGNFNKYYPAQYNTNASTAYGANVNNTSNSVVNTSTLNSVNSVLNNGVASNNVSNSIISKIGLLKNRQSSALQILNPHTGEVINSSTVNNTNTTTTHTNSSTNTVTVDTTTAENNNTLESMESIDSMENVMREISEEFNNINNLDISSSNDTSIQNTTIPSTVDLVTSDINNIPSTVDLVNNDINNIPSAVDLVNNDLNIPSTVNLVTSGTMVNGMNGMNDAKEVESIDWQDNTPTQMVPPILLISVQSRPKNKIKNKAINPAEMILTLSELHPNPNISTPNSHSKSHSRKIYNVPTEDTHTDEENVNIVTGVSEENTSTKIAEPIFVDTYSTTPEDITLITANASGEDTNIEEDSVDTMMEDVTGVSVVVDVESTNVEKQEFDYSVDNLIRLSFSVFNLEFEDLGTFKLVPHNYVIRKKPKKSQWRDISNNTATIVSTGSGTLNSVNGRMSKLDQLKRSIRTLLNKLTVENFLVVSEKIVTLYREMSLREEVEVLVELLHEKGTTELEYADMYADVAFLLRYSYNDVLDLGNKTTLFHKSLLNKCQDSFEQINSNTSLDKSVILGSIRFMGELFLRKILSINILKRISNTLLYSSRRVVPTTTTTNGTEGTTDTTNNSAEGTSTKDIGTSSSQDSTEVTCTNTNGPDTVTEENTSNTTQITNTNNTTTTNSPDTSTDNVDISNGVSDTLSEFGAEPPMNLLECFVELLTTIGYTVEQIPGGVQMLDEYTGILIQLRNSGKYPTRINFKIQDLIDLRRRNWKLKLFKEKATSVSQIHKQVEQEQLTGTINSVEGKYITAGLQVNRHYTQFLLDKRQMAIDSLVNGVYTGSTVSDKSNIDEMMSITKEFESLCSSEAFEALWKKFNPNDSETIVLFQQMLKICMNNGDLDSGLKMSDLIAFLISKIIDSDTLKAKLLNILCNNYVVRLNEEASENEHVVSFVTRIFTILFCRLSGESRNLLEKISLPNDFNTAKQLCVAVVHSVREYSTVDLGSTRRIIRRHLYSTFQHENLLFLDLI